jgi:hypothetical protein
MYTNDNYIAVCARIFATSAGASAPYTYNEANLRIDYLVNSILSDSSIRKVWNQRYLLYSGLGHGAVSSVVAMIRTGFDKFWLGNSVTGACFYDGSYNISQDMINLYDYSCSKSNSILPYERVYGRYCPWTGNDTKSTWPSPNSCLSYGIYNDSVVNFPISSLSIKNWCIVECGSNMTYCTSNVRNTESQLKFCEGINATVGYTCKYLSSQNVGHTSCGVTSSTMDYCRVWFDQLVIDEAPINTESDSSQSSLLSLKIALISISVCLFIIFCVRVNYLNKSMYSL